MLMNNGLQKPKIPFAKYLNVFLYVYVYLEAFYGLKKLNL